MASKREKGKIPHEEWGTIAARYSKGESLTSIARDYGCTAPAIRYIVKRAKSAPGEMAKQTARRAAVAAPENAALLSSSLPRSAPPRSALPRREGHEPVTEADAESTGGFDASIRQRVTGDIASFLVALDTVVAQPSSEALHSICVATDRLMRAAARTRIEAERLLASGNTAPETPKMLRAQG